jgi:hypothetical protein
MLSIERALEIALCAYESLSDEERKDALKRIIHKGRMTGKKHSPKVILAKRRFLLARR